MKNKKIKNIYKKSLIVIFLAMTFFYYNLSALADDVLVTNEMSEEEKEKIEEKNKELNKELEKLDEKAATYEKILLLKQKQTTLLGTQIVNLNSDIIDLRGEINNNLNEIKSLDEKVVALEKDILKNELSTQFQRKVLANIIRSYKENTDNALTKIMFSLENFTNFSSRDDYYIQMGDKIVEITNDLKIIQNKITANKKEVLGNKNNLVKSRQKLEEDQARLAATKTQKNTILIQTRGDEANYQTKLAEVEAKKMAIASEIEMIEGSKTENVDYSKLPPIKKGYFTYPINPVVVTQGYGKTSFAKISGIYKNNFHNGIDFGISYSRLYAVKDGQVLATGDNGQYAYGKWVAISHNDGLVTLYGHLSSIGVSAGSKIKEGEKIGITGNTGTSTGPHLHFSVFAKNTFETITSSGIKNIPTGGSVDPNRYLK